MTVAQVLVVNLLTDGMPAIALSRDPTSPETMRRRPRGRGASFTRELRAVLAVAGATVGLAATCAYAVGRELAPEAAQTMAFATIALAELAFVFSIRSQDAPAWREPRNDALVWSVLGSALVVALLIYVPFLGGPFGTKPLAAGELALVLGLALVPAALLEAFKAFRRRR
jgi:P-type Ca2+ transporter type 2C